MSPYILLILLSLCAPGFSLPSADQLIFPLYDNSEIYQSVISQVRNDHPLKHDVKRVRRLTFDLRESQLSFYDKDPEPDDYPEEYDLYHRLVALDFIGLIEQYAGYTPEEHFVDTEDGYHLTLHRISSSPEHRRRIGKPVIFIQHGLFCPPMPASFLLVDQGYDVWLGNARGNSYSTLRSHGFSNSSDFWNFSFHEIGIYDLRASIDYVLKETGQGFLNFIGYSIQKGATESYILLSKYPKYNEKIRLLIGISPFAFWEKPADQESKIQNIVDKIKKVESDTGSGELYSQSSFMQYVGRIICAVSKNCHALLSNFFGQLYSNADYVTYLNITSCMPAGTSAKTLYHLLQLIESGNFQEYDDGSKPTQIYDLTKITIPVIIFSGGVEHFIYKKDTDKFRNRLHTYNAIYRARTAEFGTKIADLDFPWADNVNNFHSTVLSLL